jgi:hypothetical protein
MKAAIKYSGILTLLSGLVILDQLQAQDFSELFSLYQQKNFSTLQQKIMSLSDRYADHDQIQFFNAVFIENGDDAFRIYEQLYPRATGIFKVILAKKLSQYYYARGFYIRAAEFDKVLAAATSSSDTVPLNAAAREKSATTQADKKRVNFIVQVGAFGQEENARNLQKSLQGQVIQSRIIRRMVNGRNLYCVWVDGGNSLEETIKIADTIKDRFKLEYRILEN